MSDPTPIKTLDIDAPIKVEYCIPLWLRDLQIQAAIKRVSTRIQPNYELRSDPIAVVSYGPSLNHTWEQIKPFKYIMTCSGAHPFLIERGVIPTWHLALDPLPGNTAKLIKIPHKAVEYLIASTCHADVFDLLDGYNIKLWHIFATEEDALRTLPAGEWTITGGCSVGLRTMTMARFLGFTDLHIFGMDGSAGESGKHAADHPGQPKGHSLVEYPKASGRMWQTTPAYLEAARGTFHELNQMPDVRATFYGEGLVQTMAKDYVPNYVKPGSVAIAMAKPELISAEYRALNRTLHQTNLAYGVGGSKHVETILKLANQIGTKSVLDYGCGKSLLAKNLPFPIWEYDPAVPGKEESPRAADLVICTDVLEHIEPDKLEWVLADISRCTKQVGFFTIHTGAAKKTLPDGRNTHLIQRKKHWWQARLEKHFVVAKIAEVGPELYVVVGPRGEQHAKQKVLAMNSDVKMLAYGVVNTITGRNATLTHA